MIGSLRFLQLSLLMYRSLLDRWLIPLLLSCAAVSVSCRMTAVIETKLSDDCTGSVKCLFSDIDGTLVHYHEDEDSAPGLPEVVPLPASSTGRMGRISLETLKLASQVRSKGVKLVLVSGTRYATFAKRLPYLPRADAYVIENGGRVFYPKDTRASGAEGSGGDGGDPDAKKAKSDAQMENDDKNKQQEDREEEESAIGDSTLTAHAPEHLIEDLDWRKTLEDVAGPASQDSKPPAKREGPLYDVYRKVISEGFEVDTHTYYTMLRVKVGSAGKPGGSEAVKELVDTLPNGLRVVTNLGMVDICPEASGKHNAAAHLAEKHFGIPLSRCASMGDDDNDIALANSMGKGAFITTFSSESVERAAKENPDQFHVAKSQGVLSSEEMLKLILEAC